MGGRGSGGDRSFRGLDPIAAEDGPKKPSGLRPSVALKWDDLIEQLPKGTLRRVDCHSLRLLAELLDQADAISERISQDPSDDRARRLLLGTVDRVARLSSVFGLTPGDRRRAHFEEEERSDDPVLLMLERMKASYLWRKTSRFQCRSIGIKRLKP
jgi:hypothetical protein